MRLQTNWILICGLVKNSRTKFYARPNLKFTHRITQLRRILSHRCCCCEYQLESKWDRRNCVEERLHWRRNFINDKRTPPPLAATTTTTTNQATVKRQFGSLVDSQSAFLSMYVWCVCVCARACKAALVWVNVCIRRAWYGVSESQRAPSNPKILLILIDLAWFGFTILYNYGSETTENGFNCNRMHRTSFVWTKRAKIWKLFLRVTVAFAKSMQKMVAERKLFDNRFCHTNAIWNSTIFRVFFCFVAVWMWQ